jgi:hypothetical protein
LKIEHTGVVFAQLQTTGALVVSKSAFVYLHINPWPSFWVKKQRFPAGQLEKEIAAIPWGESSNSAVDSTVSDATPGSMSSTAGVSETAPGSTSLAVTAWEAVPWFVSSVSRPAHAETKITTAAIIAVTFRCLNILIPFILVESDRADDAGHDLPPTATQPSSCRYVLSIERASCGPYVDR